MSSLYNSEEYIGDLKSAIHAVKDFSRFKGKTILITGATGLIGSFLTDMFCQWNSVAKPSERVNLIAAGRKLEKLEKRFSMAPGKEFLHFIEWNLMDDGFPFTGPVDYIIHAASNAYPAAFAADPVGTIMGNVLGVSNLLGYACKNHAERFLYISSGEVYGEGTKECLAFKEEDYGYVDPLNPRSCYPTAKRTAENLCAAYAKQYGVDVVVARPCHTYGPNVTDTDNRATVQFITNAVRQEPIVLKSLGQQVRSYCYIADCASAILTVLLNGRSFEAYNIANSEVRLSIAEFAQLTADLASVPLIYQMKDETAKQQQTFITRAVLESEKLEALGWLGQYSAQKGIQHTLNILNNQGYQEG